MFEGSPKELKEIAKHDSYELKVPKEELDLIVNEENVIQMIDEESHVTVRILNSKRIDAVQVKPKLIDGYLALLKEATHG
ncbi:ABC transporter, ATP-binding protein [Bacillus sp. JCM 19046]|nr:ABC transporter, ATP-binding protein [Bacillus sp. JCM 19046]